MALTGNVPPTFREIADQLGYPTTGLVWRDLMALRDLGLIDWEAGNEMTLRITAAGLNNPQTSRAKTWRTTTKPAAPGQSETAA
jgi:SOS-response transcriptional repressor LexA